jgi:hypothetical protein
MEFTGKLSIYPFSQNTAPERRSQIKISLSRRALNIKLSENTVLKDYMLFSNDWHCNTDWNTAAYRCCLFPLSHMMEIQCWFGLQWKKKNNIYFSIWSKNNSKYTECPKKIVPFFFLGAQCVESGVSCTDCY